MPTLALPKQPLLARVTNLKEVQYEDHAPQGNYALPIPWKTSPTLDRHPSEYTHNPTLPRGRV